MMVGENVVRENRWNQEECFAKPGRLRQTRLVP